MATRATCFLDIMTSGFFSNLKRNRPLLACVQQSSLISSRSAYEIFNMLNFSEDYKRCIHISNHILDFVQQKKTRFTMDQPYTLSILYRAASRLAPSQWETSLHRNGFSHWLGANLQSALIYCQYYTCWCPGDLRRQGISRHDINQIG